jgi:hypothetical protein
MILLLQGPIGLAAAPTSARVSSTRDASASTVAAAPFLISSLRSTRATD